mmetsp:Transcript_29933/g.50931  ORF Transcript_29933/g.50931 Transcript_29933/m.50931 type:complete len:119 (-) Transcript_29933:238-594(-)
MGNIHHMLPHSAEPPALENLIDFPDIFDLDHPHPSFDIQDNETATSITTCHNIPPPPTLSRMSYPSPPSPHNDNKNPSSRSFELDDAFHNLPEKHDHNEVSVNDFMELIATLDENLGE